MRGKMKKAKREKKVYIYKIFVVAIFLCLAIFTLKIAPNYIRNDITGKTNLVINNSNITKRLKNDVIVEDDVVYISTKDIANFFDGHIYYDNIYNQLITTSNTKVATMKIDEKKTIINDVSFSLIASAKKINDNFYIPFSEVGKAIYNVETKYVEDTDTVILTSLDKELTYCISSKNNNVKYKPTLFSKNVDKVGRGDTITLVNTDESIPEGWKKVATENGKIGYIKTNSITNIQQMRENLKVDNQIDGKVSLVWDYFSIYGSAPQRTGSIEGVNVVSPTFFALKEGGKGEITANVGTKGTEYINWAHSQGYKVWALVSNDSLKTTTSEVLNDYKLRNNLINNILFVVENYNLDGINIDFENIKMADKDVFSRFIIELAPRLRDLGKVITVDVTAPDGSEDWSLCYDRNVLGDVADYIVFMAYDQHGNSSTEAGTVAGYDWIENSLNKFINREEVDSNKIILGMPFYTRVWVENDEKLDSFTIEMKETDKYIPDGVQKEWKDDVKQNYVEYQKDGKIYKIWIEDEESIKCKFELIEKYNLAGAAYWEKDKEPDSIWKLISEKLNIK